MTMQAGNETNQTPGQGQPEPQQPQAQQPQAQGIARPEVTGQEQQPKTDAPMTRAEVEALINEREKKIIERSQSVFDRARNAVDQKIAELKAIGINVTTEQAQKLIDNEAAQGNLQGQPQPPANVAQTGQAATASADPVTAQALQWAKEDGLANPDPVNLEAYRMMAEAGIHFKDGDPLLAMIDPNAEPEVWKGQVKAALEKAKERAAMQGNPARMPAATTGQPSGKPSHAGKNATETLDEYYNGLQI